MRLAAGGPVVSQLMGLEAREQFRGQRTRASAWGLPATKRFMAFGMASASVRSVLTRLCCSFQLRGHYTFERDYPDDKPSR